ncbi:MAG: SDR family oxidoreductase [Nitrosarchaeum sp.]|jgi:NAD(P)-dependent dehydrogenase (short-subunit alcohol dehydrogenase family)|uniref:SDR family oxidoreductase n=1 Tax=Nitrosarchaeum sp. TaxID=2026886 RepID=UPI002DEE1421|nr:SDR family oxidoreductase [Nitrosarchaeum sp.]
MEKVAIVTGTTSGIGYETCLSLARDGFYTFATVRDVKKAEKIVQIAKKENLKIEIIEMDVDDEKSISAAIQKILSKKQQIDVLVNNAGWILFGSVEDVPVNDFRAQFETNFFGIISIIQKVAPVMRKQKSGIIVNISSVAGRIGFPGSPAYISSKFALEGLSESLRYELGQFGVKVIIIEPGVIKSNFFSSMKIAEPKPDSPYKEITERVIIGVKMMAELGTPPSEVATTILKVIKEKDPKPRYIVGNDAQMFLEAKRAKTDTEFENYLKKELFPS